MAVVGSSAAYRQIASGWGRVHPGGHPNLKHYPYTERHLPAIDRMLAHHGYQHYYAGGSHGKPDLARKNYDTEHLMIWDPSSGSGGDFKNQHYTEAWRKTHELAHALTRARLNQMYGEGRRLGKLGVRSPREATRAVHWEWLAAHKQRELSAKHLGIHVSDRVFHKELNTVMHDAVHRAITGKFAEPGDEGFHPAAHRVSLQHGLRMVQRVAHRMGLHSFKRTGPLLQQEAQVADFTDQGREEQRRARLQAFFQEGASSKVSHLHRILNVLKSLKANAKVYQQHMSTTGIGSGSPGDAGAARAKYKAIRAASILARQVPKARTGKPPRLRKFDAKLKELLAKHHLEGA